MLLHLEAFDWNCPQFITPRFTEGEIAEALAPVNERLEQLEAENRMLREKLAAAGPVNPQAAERHLIRRAAIAERSCFTAALSAGSYPEK